MISSIRINSYTTTALISTSTTTTTTTTTSCNFFPLVICISLIYTLTMSDTDFAFNNYCIACDKLCPTNSIYCSESCKAIDEQQSSSIIDQSHHSHHHQEQSLDYNDEVNDMVSPLLTPSLYQHYNNNYATANNVNDSPLLLSSKNYQHEDSSDVNYFDLNYLVSQYSNATSSTNIADHLPSTSHNYRKWLTACL